MKDDNLGLWLGIGGAALLGAVGIAAFTLNKTSSLEVQHKTLEGHVRGGDPFGHGMDEVGLSSRVANLERWAELLATTDLPRFDRWDAVTLLPGQQWAD